MNDTGIKIENLDKLNAALAKAPVKLAEELKDAMAISIAEIHKEAIPRTPFDKGKLRQAYREKISKLQGILSNSTVYAMRQHEGFFRHPKAGERHYLLNAVNAKKRKVEQNIEKAIENTWRWVKTKTII